MTVVEHGWTIFIPTRPRGKFALYALEGHEREGYSGYRGVEVVPADQLTGAVSALDRVASWCRDGAHPDKIAWEAERAARVARGMKS